MSIHECCATSNLQELQNLLAEGVDVHYASTSLINSNQIIDELIRYGCDLNATTPFGDTPLHLATMTAKLDVIKTLIERSDLSLTDYRGQTAFDLATTDKDIFMSAHQPIKEPCE